MSAKKENIMIISMTNGTVQIESYENVCHNLGFDPNTHFVKVTNRGTITYTCGKPNEIRELKKACQTNGYKMAKSLKDTIC